MSANGEGLMSQSHQYPGSPTQAATYTSNFATTTQQQTTMTTSNQFNNTYIPAYQQNVSSNPQYLGQAQNLLYQQQAVPQWPQKTQEFLVPQPQPAPTPAPAPTPQQVPLQHQPQSQAIQSSSRPPLVALDLPQHQQQPMI
jgi:hypothetical protein